MTFRITTGSQALPPFQWSEFQVHSSVQDTTPQNGVLGTLNKLEWMNFHVNSGISPRQTKPGVMDGWSLWPVIGWCGDYSVTKRHELLKNGWPSNALLITTAKTQKGEDHCVLVVRLPDQDLVLDNLTDALLQPNQTGHTFELIQSEDNPHNWFKANLAQ